MDMYTQYIHLVTKGTNTPKGRYWLYKVQILF